MDISKMVGLPVMDRPGGTRQVGEIVTVSRDGERIIVRMVLTDAALPDHGWPADISLSFSVHSSDPNGERWVVPEPELVDGTTALGRTPKRQWP
jgi:hypothetical protein